MKTVSRKKKGAGILSQHDVNQNYFEFPAAMDAADFQFKIVARLKPNIYLLVKFQYYLIIRM